MKKSAWLPLTPAQSGLFFAHQLAPENPCYTTAEVVRLPGDLFVPALKAAIARSYIEFEQMRVQIRLTDDGPEQQVQTICQVPFFEESADSEDDANALIWRHLSLPIPVLDRPGGVLAKAGVVHLPEGDWFWHAAHHLLLDGYGAQQLFRRIAEIYGELGDQPGSAQAGPSETAEDRSEVKSETVVPDSTAEMGTETTRTEPIVDPIDPATRAAEFVNVNASQAEDIVGLEALVSPADPEGEAFWQERIKLWHHSGGVSLAGREAAPAGRARRRAVTMPAELCNDIKTGAKRLKVPWTDLFLAATGSYIARMRTLDSTRVGLPQMNRTLPGVGVLPTAHSVCTAMNVLPITIPGQGTVAECLQAVAEEEKSVRAHPFTRQEKLSRMLQDAQLFGAQINIIPFDLNLKFGSLRGTLYNLTAGPVEDMTICMRGVPTHRGNVRLELDGNPSLYTEAELGLHMPRLLHWLESWCHAEPDTPLSTLSILPKDEERLVTVDFNATEYGVRAKNLATRFVEQARRTPNAIALRFAGRPVPRTELNDNYLASAGVENNESVQPSRTYAQLLDTANRVAQQLAELGVKPGDVVGLKLPRSLAQYEMLYAVLLAGACYLPLDLDQPESRLEIMAGDAKVALVVDVGLAQKLLGLDAGELSAPVPGKLALDEDLPGWPNPLTSQREQSVDFAPGLSVSLESVAYVLFTSGSTGRPKGVKIGHRAIDNRLAWMQHHLPLAEGDLVLHKTPISFDVSVWELYWPLQVGATVLIAPPGAQRDPRQLAELANQVDVMHLVPSMLRAFLTDQVACQTAQGLRYLVTSGEALTADLVQGAGKVFGTYPVNLYGPTEAAVDVTCWDSSPQDEEVPIGYPIWNTQCYVFNPIDYPRLRPVPVGVKGELYLGGVQLAEGYIGRPDLDKEVFKETEYGRLYKTGDIASWRPDGALNFYGRSDDQVKIHGQRVELGEVETVIANLPGIEEAAVGVVDDTLVAWIVVDRFPAEVGNVTELGTPAEPVDSNRVFAWQSQTRADLPKAWVPTRWIELAEMPHGATGKINRKWLKDLARQSPTTRSETVIFDSYEGGTRTDSEGTDPQIAPHSFTAQQICAVVAEELHQPTVSPEGDFFNLGADSLKALRILSEVEKRIGVRLTLADIFTYPTPAKLAARAAQLSVQGSEGAATDPYGKILALRENGLEADQTSVRPPLFCLPPAGGLGWCYSGLLRYLPTDLDVYTLQHPGIGTGNPEQFGSLSALAEYQLATIREVVGSGPFSLLGWSLGGMAAQAVATIAREDEQEVEQVICLDAYPATQWQSQPEPSYHDALLGLLRLGAAQLEEGQELNNENVNKALRRSGSALAALDQKIVDGILAAVLDGTRIVRTDLDRAMPGDMLMVVADLPRAEDWLDPHGWDEKTRGNVRYEYLPLMHEQLVHSDQVGAILGALFKH